MFPIWDIFTTAFHEALGAREAGRHHRHGSDVLGTLGEMVTWCPTRQAGVFLGSEYIFPQTGNDVQFSGLCSWGKAEALLLLLKAHEEMCQKSLRSTLGRIHFLIAVLDG